ncbi:hypothetical protein [Polymorphobacter arshaanensis]|uniref:hypothetical protein n=1 Tax=Glacieibacterium arshaanense TaxID=2511025 RepID=UPI00140D7283|nr:hypothetical protein [Polymorphobacter arshaanensis]
MSIKLGVVAAETFAVVLRTVNPQIVNDIRKLAPPPQGTDTYSSPTWPVTIAVFNT